MAHRGQAADAASYFVTSLPISLHSAPADQHRAWDLARRYDNHTVYNMMRPDEALPITKRFQ